MGWGAVSLGVVSSNQVERTDWTPMGLAELAVLMLSLRRLWYTGGIIHAGTKTVINICKDTCPLEQANRLKHHTATNTKHDDPQIPEPDLRFASGKTKQTAKAKNSRKRGQAQTEHPQNRFCHETQWLVHCITPKSVPNELISRLSGKHEG